MSKPLYIDAGGCLDVGQVVDVNALGNTLTRIAANVGEGGKALRGVVAAQLAYSHDAPSE